MPNTQRARAGPGILATAHEAVCECGLTYASDVVVLCCTNAWSITPGVCLYNARDSYKLTMCCAAPLLYATRPLAVNPRLELLNVGYGNPCQWAVFWEERRAYIGKSRSAIPVALVICKTLEGIIIVKRRCLGRLRRSPAMRSRSSILERQDLQMCKDLVHMIGPSGVDLRVPSPSTALARWGLLPGLSDKLCLSDPA